MTSTTATGRPGATTTADTGARNRDVRNDGYLADGTYPINLDVSGRPVLVVGAGPVGARKAGGLIDAGATVTMVAPDISDAVEHLKRRADREHRSLSVQRRRYRRGEAASHRLVITATNDPAVNRQVFRDCEAAGVWCNSADDLDNCSFILPAITRRHPFTVTVSSTGVSPALASWLNRRIGADLPDDLRPVSDLVSTVRADVKKRYSTTEAVDWATALDTHMATLIDLIDTGREGEAETVLARALRPFTPDETP